MSRLEPAVRAARAAVPVRNVSVRSQTPHLPWAVVAPALVVCLAVAMAVGTMVGPASIPLFDVARVLVNHLLHQSIAVPAITDSIIWQIRLPRVVLAALVGASLGYGGAAYQGVLRNPLADPYLLGVASGAGLAATAVMVGLIPLVAAQASLVTLAAFGGGLAAIAVSYALARASGTTRPGTLILAGVAVSALAVAATSFLLLARPRETIPVLSWLMGSFSSSDWTKLWLIVPYTVPAAIVVFLHGRLLNVMQSDDVEAQQLGVNVEWTRALVLAAASLAAAAAVSVAGIIGFVGLVAPHVVRLLIGPDYRHLVPGAAILGAALLVCADIAARTVISPAELPIGVITAFLGTPLLLYLLHRRQGTLS
jgi:iron complex transport system permease protein